MSDITKRKRGPRPSRATQPRFERVDSAKIEESAYDATLERLNKLPDVDARLGEAVAIIDEADAELPAMRERRDRMAVSMSIYDGARAVYTAAGIGRTQFTKVRRAALGGAEIPLRADNTVDRDALLELARKHKVRQYRTARTTLPKLATEIATMAGTAAAARKVRDEIVLAKLEAGGEGNRPIDLAKVIRREPSRIAHLVARTARIAAAS